MSHDPAEHQPAEAINTRQLQPEAKRSHAEHMNARLVELNTAHSAELRHLHHVATEARESSAQQPSHRPSPALGSPEQIPAIDNRQTTRPAMTPGQKRFYASEQCKTARATLQELVDSPLYNTDSDYYSDNERDFVERHLHVLSTQQKPNLPGYMSNLKLMTKIKTRH